MNLLQMSSSGAVMILAVAAARAFAINRLPKQTFLALWGVVLLRLLVPFSFPSPLSAYSLIRQPPASQAAAGLAAALPASPAALPAAGAAAPQQAAASVPLPLVVWAVGFALCALFFAACYFKCRREFRESLPVTNGFLTHWLAEHKTARPIEVRQSGRIAAPLTYGIFKPVILLPKSTRWDDTAQISYILAHEFVHIRRFDAAAKLLLTAALCVHWFNPLVWVMYLLSNRDLELSCDEAVVRSFGVAAKSAYARTLLCMEEKKSRLTPLCNNFSKNAIEQRIRAIMKIKKTSFTAILAAIALIVCVTTAFATSAVLSQNNLNASTGHTLGEYERQKLADFKFDGYEAMTVAAYQEKAWQLRDTSDYQEVLERISQNNMLYRMRYNNNSDAAFLFNILEPLTAEKWQTRDFSGSSQAPSDKLQGERATLEYTLTLSISDADTLTVGQYDKARQSVEDGMHNILQSKTNTELQDENAMNAAILAEIAALKGKWQTPSLQFEMDYSFLPLTVFDGANSGQYAEDREPRGTPGTEEDYQSLLALKTADYQQKTVASFNRAVLDWGNEHFDAWERTRADLARDDFRVMLTDDERAFLTSALTYSAAENEAYVKSYRTGEPEQNPNLGSCQLMRDATDETGSAWCRMEYGLTYHIADKTSLTVGERDSRLTEVFRQIQAFWQAETIDELLAADKDDFQARFDAIARQNSGKPMEITMLDLFYEGMDERREEDGAPSAEKTGSMATVTIGGKVLYLVDSEEDLRAIASSDESLSKRYILNRDIALTEEWTSIGDFGHPFTGNFSGNGYEISNLKNTSPNAVFAGLFGYAEGAQIYNVILRNVGLSASGSLHSGAVAANAVDCEIYDNQVL